MRNFLAITLALAPFAAHAVVATTSKTAPVVADTVWSYVGRMSGGSAVAIGRYTVLTAAHIGAGAFTLGTSTYRLASTEIAPNVSGATDLRVVHLLDALPGWYALGSSIKSGNAVTMVGYGGTGVVNATETGYSLTSGGVRRAGGNVVTGKGTTSGRGPTMRAALDHAGEGVLAGGDSGGGWFSGGKLVGISSFTYTNDAKKPAYGFAGRAYFGSGAVDLTNSRLRAWALAEASEVPTFLQPAPVPEPASMAALALGAGALLRRRRRG